MTLTEIRSSRYWVMQGNSVVKELISKCVTCQRLRGKVGEQIMADLPPDRAKEEPPFTYFGVDMFRPFEIQERKMTFKWYDALFTCLASQAIHVEVTKTLETDSFILTLRRFIARRGNVKSIWCDNGGNFVGAKSEIAKMHQRSRSKQNQRNPAKTKCWLDTVENEPSFGKSYGRCMETNKVCLCYTFINSEDAQDNIQTCIR